MAWLYVAMLDYLLPLTFVCEVDKLALDFMKILRNLIFSATSITTCHVAFSSWIRCLSEVLQNEERSKHH